MVIRRGEWKARVYDGMKDSVVFDTAAEYCQRIANIMKDVEDVITELNKYTYF